MSFVTSGIGFKSPYMLGHLSSLATLSTKAWSLCSLVIRVCLFTSSTSLLILDFKLLEIRYPLILQVQLIQNRYWKFKVKWHRRWRRRHPVWSTMSAIWWGFFKYLAFFAYFFNVFWPWLRFFRKKMYFFEKIKSRIKTVKKMEKKSRKNTKKNAKPHSNDFFKKYKNDENKNHQ